MISNRDTDTASSLPKDASRVHDVGLSNPEYRYLLDLIIARGVLSRKRLTVATIRQVESVVQRCMTKNQDFLAEELGRCDKINL